MNILVVSADPLLASTMSDVSEEFAIETQHIGDHEEAVERLNRARYVGLVLDLDTIPNPRSFIASVHQGRGNHTLVVFAVATKIDQIEKALEGRANFVLRRPVQAHAIRKTLRSAYDLLSGKQRRDFRHPANLPVSLTPIPSGMAVNGATVNVSSHGIAVVTPEPLKIADAMRISLTLPDAYVVEANGVVIWSDEHGKAGLHFQCTSAEMRERLDAWLDTQFARMDRPVGALMKGVGY